ncbi:MAG: hypothetical protein M1828_004438 [Chrysothrix sp. TS-e1954]|nr:MAG: hypothetical protein M1828_004438 [Chrysothrix sp. TS-e1954]
MPHSVSPPGSSPPQDHEELPDASPNDEVNPPMSLSQSTSCSDLRNQKAHEQPQNKSLENMFDDESDDEFSSSAVEPPAALSSAQPTKFSDPEVMRAFYARVFPTREIFRWLNHSTTPTNDFAHREFAFTLPNDAYLRYQSFVSADLFRKQLTNLTPSRFEIGPVYSTNPRDRKTLRRAAAFRPLSKELVFDIDMTDYDPIRTCCTGANICSKCWSFMTMAIKVLDAALREDFGFRHILWVYSGRRGVHAWVCDKRARNMPDNMRKSVAGYLEVLKGGDSSGKRINLKRPLHPHLERSLRLLRPHFQHDVLGDQDPFEGPPSTSLDSAANASHTSHLLSVIPDPTLRSSLQSKWTSTTSRSSAQKWADIDALASAGGSNISASFDSKKLLEAKQDLLLEYTYPRLDAAVSKHLNHLLKSPFCVHPGTGRVCVPIDMKNVLARDEDGDECFDPLSVPTVTQLLGEIDSYQGDSQDAGRAMPDWEKTSLKPYVEYFAGFVATLLQDEGGLGKRGRDDADAMEF